MCVYFVLCDVSARVCVCVDFVFVYVMSLPWYHPMISSPPCKSVVLLGVMCVCVCVCMDFVLYDVSALCVCGFCLIYVMSLP